MNLFMTRNQPFASGLVMLAICFSILACSGKKDDAAQDASTHDDSQTDAKEWPEMDAFHLIMAESFHPYKDTLNLGPARANADALASAAEKWSDAPLPKKADNDNVKAKLQQLKTDTHAFAEMVKSGDDKETGEALTKLHDLFHEIQEAWYGGGEGHYHH
jgi:hypothetical protein